MLASARLKFGGRVTGRAHEGGHSVQIDDIHRRIRNILLAYPATDWTLEESCSVLEALAGIVRARQTMSDVIDIGA